MSTDSESTGSEADSGTPNTPPTPPEDTGTDAAAAPARPAWPRLALFGLAGIAGGALAASVLMLSDVPGGIQHRVDALQSRLESADFDGGNGQTAALRRRLEDLGAELSELRTREPALTADPAVQNSLSRINDELADLDARLARISGDASRANTLLRDRLERVEALIPNDLPSQLQRTATRDSVDTLQRRIARLERDEMTRDVRRASLALALAHLSRATQASRPFEAEWQALKALQPDNPLVAALGPYARTGLPAVATLSGRFDKVADDTVSAWRREKGQGFFERLWDGLVGLFRVRPVGEAEGVDAPAVVARAEQRLQDGDLYLAVQELEKLDGAAQDAASAWLKAAEARLRLDDLVAQVNRQVLQEVAEAEAERDALRRRTPEPAAPGAPEAGTPEGEDPGAEAPDENGPAGALPEAGDAPEETPSGRTSQPQGEAGSGASER